MCQNCYTVLGLVPFIKPLKALTRHAQTGPRRTRTEERCSSAGMTRRMSSVSLRSVLIYHAHHRESQTPSGWKAPCQSLLIAKYKKSSTWIHFKFFGLHDPNYSTTLKFFERAAYIYPRRSGCRKCRNAWTHAPLPPRRQTIECH